MNYVDRDAVGKRLEKLVTEVEYIKTDPLCLSLVGDKPWWMNRDQWEAVACICKLPLGHKGDHDCLDEGHK